MELRSSAPKKSNNCSADRERHGRKYEGTGAERCPHLAIRSEILLIGYSCRELTPTTSFNHVRYSYVVCDETGLAPMWIILA